MLDIGYVIMVEPPPPDAGWRPGYRGTPFSVWQVFEQSPAVAALAVVSVPKSGSASLSHLFNDMRIDRSANAAAQIPVSVPAPAPLSADTAGDASEAPLRLAIKRYQVELTSVALDYEVSRPAYIQLSYSAYQYLQLYLDGQPRDYFWTAFSLAGFVSPAGEHRVELRAYRSPLRVVSYWIDGLGLLAIAIMAFTRLANSLETWNLAVGLRRFHRGRPGARRPAVRRQVCGAVAQHYPGRGGVLTLERKVDCGAWADSVGGPATRKAPGALCPKWYGASPSRPIDCSPLSSAAATGRGPSTARATRAIIR